MENICRLCLSANFVKNYIFDDETALHVKMSLYMPIKVFKDDQLPQNICDKCSCKVNDLYQFCNEAIEVQNRLRAALASSTLLQESGRARIKRNHSPEPTAPRHAATQTHHEPALNEQGVTVKKEPQELSPSAEVKSEEIPHEAIESDNWLLAAPSHDSDSDNLSLLSIKKKKQRKKHKKVKEEVTNGDVKPIKGKKGKRKVKDWLLDDEESENVQNDADKLKKIKIQMDSEDDHETYNCCMCFMKCYSRPEMLQHYKEHGARRAPSPPPPPAPPVTDGPARCPRCLKMVQPEEWADHWRRHWLHDAGRPFRCGRCEQSYRQPQQILQHGLTHEKETGTVEQTPPEKRFMCDLCPETFVFMRYLLAHRALDHRAAISTPLELRCAACGRRFAHLNSLRRHLRAHSGRRDHLCSVCGKALSSREHLKFHLRIHAGHKPNVCRTCGKGFVKKCNLTLHERTHSGEKPHACSHCGKAFSQRSTLVIHERYHSGARPYSCSLCGRGFVAKGLLSMHLKTTCI